MIWFLIDSGNMKIFPWLLPCIAAIIAVLGCKDSISRGPHHLEGESLLDNAQKPGRRESDADPGSNSHGQSYLSKEEILDTQYPYFGLSENGADAVSNSPEPYDNSLLANVLDEGRGEHGAKKEACKDDPIPESPHPSPRLVLKNARTTTRMNNYNSPPTANPHEFRWTVFLFVHVRHYIRRCVGSLVALDETQTESDLVVTAAHNVIYPATSMNSPLSYVDPMQVTVLLGRHNLQLVEPGEKVRYADRYIILTPQYDIVNKIHDIIGIKLNKMVKFSPTIQPIYLPKQDERLPLSTKCYTSGWGFDGTGYPVIMKKMEIKRRRNDRNDGIGGINSKNCYDGWYSIVMRTSTFRETEMICGEPYPSYGDLCDGDDGAGLACERPNDNKVLVPKLFGVFSFSRQGSCNDRCDSYPIFAKVPYYSDRLKAAARSAAPVSLPPPQQQPGPAQSSRAPGFPGNMRDPDCGIPSDKYPQTQKRIVGGGVANPHSWPWQVHVKLILDSSGTPRVVYSGGSVIRVSEGDNESDIVVTTAHTVAFPYAGRYYKYNPRRIKSFFGRHNRLSVHETRAETRNAIKIVLNRGFSHTQDGFRNDTALIKLDRPVSLLGDKIRAICRPKATDLIPFNDKNCVTTGWGRISEDMQLSPRLLHQARLEIFRPEECTSNGLGWNSPPYVFPEMICAGSMNEAKGACAGDYGGTVKCPVSSQWTMFGINSFSFDQSRCFASGRPPIAMSAVHFADWISDEAEMLTSVRP